MARRSNKPTVLAIDPGTRHLGIAVLDGDALAYHGVKTIPRRLTPHERLKAARRIVERLIRDFRPDVLAIEKAFFSHSRNAALLKLVADEIVGVGRLQGLPLVALAPSTVKRRVAGNGGASKPAVAAAVIARYPELEVYRGQDRTWKERYHGNMFDAVAVGLAVGNKRLSPVSMRRATDSS